MPHSLRSPWFKSQSNEGGNKSNFFLNEITLISKSILPVISFSQQLGNPKLVLVVTGTVICHHVSRWVQGTHENSVV